MLDILGTGLIIGFAIAAPVGPIGILCIRRTLMEGRWIGLATGMGAATADGIYGIIVATGLSVTGVLESFGTPMQIGGGILIMVLGALSVKRYFSLSTAQGKPLVDGAQPSIQAEGGSVRRLGGAWSSTLLLTLSNPMTMLAFLGIMAAQGIEPGGGALTPYVLVAGVFLGSAAWWLLLVHGTLFARRWVTQDTARWIDLVSGLVLIAWGGWIAAAAL